MYSKKNKNKKQTPPSRAGCESKSIYKQSKGFELRVSFSLD